MAIYPEHKATDKQKTRYNLNEQIKDACIDTLREAFSRHDVYKYVPDARGMPDLDNTKIVITDVYSYDQKLLPAIVTTMTGGRDYVIAMNQNLGALRKDIDGNWFQQWVGGWDVTLNCVIGAEDTISREELSSFVSMMFMYWARMALLDKGVFVKNTSIGGESEEPYANDFIYFSNVSIELYTEWEARLPISDTLESVQYNIAWQKNQGERVPWSE